MTHASTLTEKDREADVQRRGDRYSALFSELFSALVQCDPGRMVSCPGYGLGMAPAHDLFIDEMAGIDSDEMRSRVCYVIGCAARSKDEALQQMALKLLRDVAHGQAEARKDL